MSYLSWVNKMQRGKHLLAENLHKPINALNEREREREVSFNTLPHLKNTRCKKWLDYLHTYLCAGLVSVALSIYISPPGSHPPRPVSPSLTLPHPASPSLTWLVFSHFDFSLTLCLSHPRSLALICYLMLIYIFSYTQWSVHVILLCYLIIMFSYFLSHIDFYFFSIFLFLSLFLSFFLSSFLPLIVTCLSSIPTCSLYFITLF